MGMANAGTQASLSVTDTLPQYDSLAAISVMIADLANRWEQSNRTSVDSASELLITN
jgi:hypothetical protein